MQKARRHPTKGLRPLVSARFQVLFHPLTQGTFTFPSRYWFTIGRCLVFSLTQWSARIHTGFHVSRATQELPRSRQVFGYRSITFFGSSFQMIHLTIKVPTLGSYNPGPASGPGLGCSLFARRYWGNRILFLFLRLLRCFTSAGIALHVYVFNMQ